MTAPQRRAAVIGLGLLGGALARRLVQQSWPVTGFDVDEAARSAAREGGVVVRESAIDAVADAGCVVLCLPTSKISRDCLNEILPAAGPSTLILDATTGNPEEMAAAHAAAAEEGVAYLDCCVCGSSVLAERGEIVLVIGGEPETVERSEPLLTDLARKRFHVGPAGAGARMKLVVNLVLGLNRAALAEGLSFARSLGLDGDQSLDVLQSGPAASEVMQAKGQKMLTKDFSPQARLSQHRKDVGLILEQAAARGIALPLSEAHRDLLDHCVRMGLGDLDNSAVIAAYSGAKSAE